jgi:hypothetical protein
MSVNSGGCFYFLLVFYLSEMISRRENKTDCLRMLPHYELLHQTMLGDINRCMQQDSLLQERAELCYWIANKYWGKLKVIAGFNNEAEEIDFFKTVKVAFTSYIEYYTLLVGGLVGEKATIDVINYWEEELLKCKRFFFRHEDFINYYESRDQRNDKLYFKRLNGDKRPVGRLMSYDNDLFFCSSHDQLVRSLLAHKMYDEYVKGKLKGLAL